MLTDKNKGITSIKYNHLNLPTEIVWNSTKKINYLYNATGQKLKKTVTDGSTITTTDYLDGFQYINTILEFFPTAQGYVKATVTSIGTNGTPVYAYNYVYNHTDHLGNVRVSYAKDPQTGSVKILDENHYYPFGLKHTDYNTQGLIKHDDSVIIAPIANNPFKYKYNGKELQDELGLNMYDMDMRMYDPAIARWIVMDPVIHHSMSPYNAFDNNPVFWADPSGADVEGGGDTGGGNSSSDNYSGYTTGVKLAFGVSLNSVINSGAAVSFSGNLQSTGRKAATNSQNSSGNSAQSSNSNSDFDWSSVTFSGGDPNAVGLDEVTVVNGDYEGAMMQGVNQAESYINTWNRLSGQSNWFFGTGAALSSARGGWNSQNMYSQGMRRGLSGNYQLTGRNLSQFGNAPPTKASMPVSSFSKFGSIAGKTSLGVGVAIDMYGALTGSTSWEKAGLNTGMGVLGLVGGGYGTVLSTMYFAGEAFYPGGSVQMFSDYGSGVQEVQQGVGPDFRLIPFGPK